MKKNLILEVLLHYYFFTALIAYSLLKVTLPLVVMLFINLILQSNKVIFHSYSQKLSLAVIVQSHLTKRTQHLRFLN